ncbi:hypothetical protein FQN49_008447 [Arthroderma sp. PD_2]|nr:hypothetical protein FQN49_008447 [Arthroderma sp. PD_2]
MFDVCFTIGFLAICIMTRHGIQPCSGSVDTPIGSGDAKDPATGYGKGGFGTGRGKNLTYMPALSSACKLEKAVFAISIIGISLFLLAIPAQRGYTKRRQNANVFTTSPPQKSTSTGVRNHFWPFRKSQTPTKSATGVDYSQGRSSTGVIPLNDRQQEEKPPRYTSIFHRLRGDSSENQDPENIRLQPSGQGSSIAPTGFNPGYEYGKSAYTITSSPDPPVSPTSTEASNPWARPGYAEYAYGQSGTETGAYAHGYGDTLYKK